MGLVKPDQPEFDLDEWRALAPTERLRLMCVTWATQGFGAPDVVYVLYQVKLAFYVGGFLLFAAFSDSLGGPTSIAQWWSRPAAFQKAIIWTMLYEVLGLGCGSGPLTGHYGPMFPAVRHWLRAGTIRLPPFRWVPLTAGHRRTRLDAAVYAALLSSCTWALVSNEVGRGPVIAILCSLAVIGLRDKTVFLAARSEHYAMTAFVFLFPATELWPGAKTIQLLLWVGAGVSKLTPHFTSVMAIMQSNSPVHRFPALRRKLWRHYPTDLRPSRRAASWAHGAAFLEFAFPLTLAFTTGGTAHTVALTVMVVFHLGILTSIPMGVPLEWNVMFIYSGLVLFGAHGDVRFWSMTEPLLIAAILALVAVGPVWGNLRPDKVSFLPAMRYYAGNWAPSIWLFAPGALERIDDCVTKAAPLHRTQLEGTIEPGTYDVTMARGQAFRSMHLHGRALATLLPRAHADLGDLDAFELLDGEMIAGLVLGWNFGDGHLHDESLLAALQAECGWRPGDVRCLFVESQPIHRPTMDWRIVDAATGELDRGTLSVRELAHLQPWGEPTPASA
jgi:hypothetical protein